MNSKHSFAETNTNTLLRDTFIEFSSVTGRPMQLKVTPNKYTLKEYLKDDIIFYCEDKVIVYLREQISESEPKMSNM